MQLLVKTLEGKTLCLSFEGEEVPVLSLKEKLESICGIPAPMQRLSTSCRELSNSHTVSDSVQIQIGLRVLGGKGGFGALLKGQGAAAGQKRITNFDDCRDLNGNRIRTVSYTHLTLPTT
eukprot:TRINITY_DN833_c0_g1_i3.p1 TRINITY_DN833_c0_g1~~TRINITY_DN833_c0_g1_i3.p1  ORF type:complete len:120 (+),score=11.62 TRINITY_DN833_c0_g1_i3:90-449(+)